MTAKPLTGDEESIDDQILERVRASTHSIALSRLRDETAAIVGKALRIGGSEVTACGRLLSAIANETSSSVFGDEAIAVGLLLQIGGELITAATPMLSGDQHYAGAALVRQVVEVEYLLWAFGEGDDDAARWLKSTRKKRQSFFQPAQLRKRSAGRFLGSDYQHHCEQGGHPVPRSEQLLGGSNRAVAQLLLGDVLLHGWRTLDSAVTWASARPDLVDLVARRLEPARRQLARWRSVDPLYGLPSAPPLAD